MTFDGPATTAAPHEAASNRLSFYILLVAACAVCAFNLWRYRDYLLDDTFISLRYAKNLVDGNGLVYNVGERVEGYTNFLLVMLAAGFLKLGIDPVIATKWVCVGAAVWTIALVIKLERLGQRVAAPSLALLFLLPLEAFAYWAVCGMETMLFTALFLCALNRSVRESVERRWRGSVVVFVLLALTRPEGVLCFALSTTVFCVIEFRRDRSWSHLWRYAVNGVVFAATFGAYGLWRYTYYGHLLPNTFYAKVTGDEGQLLSGLLYLRDWVLVYPLLAAMIAAPLLLLIRRCRRLLTVDHARVAIALVASAYAVYVVGVGGDFMVFDRFFFPIMPLCCVLLAWVCQAITPRWQRIVIIVVAVANVGVSLPTTQPHHAFVAHRTAVVGEVVGHWLRTLVRPDDLIAVNPAGALPYYSNLPALDMLGLTDETIARRPVFIVSPGWAGHRRGWGEYVLKRQPRIILWYNTAGSREPYYLGDHELADNPSFRFFYRLKTVTLPAAGGAPGHVAQRFLGSPFGTTASGQGVWGEMGLTGSFGEGFIPTTTLYEAPIIVNYFERELRDDALWELSRQFAGDPNGFVDAARSRWLGNAATDPPGDPVARAQVDAMCGEALRLIQAHDYRAASALLETAAQRNRAARSPLVYQYIANVAVIADDLFTAVAAQKEALRLDPGNELYLSNFKRLLTVPYKESRPRRPRDRLAD